jgi:UDP-N-acetyl-D-mannosaminuronic acid dehydrogenase
MGQHQPLQTQLYDAEGPPTDQRAAFTGGDVPVAVYGLGKVGTPLAAVLAAVTGNAVGVDIDESVVAAVENGQSPVEEPGLAEAVATTVENGALAATSDPREAAREASVHVVVVPTLLDGDDRPDLAALDRAVADIGSGLAPGDLVLVESTVPPGTCRELVQPGLVEASGLAPDAFGLAFCPERTASGTALRDIRTAYPKVVGGRDPESTRAAGLVYEEVTDNEVLTVEGCTAAECVKLFEGVYRDVNIALANEFAWLADELPVDVNAAIDVANTQPYCDIHTPGPGVGGHCIPYYPYFLAEAVDTSLPLVGRARETNESMPAYTVGRLRVELDRAGTAVSEAAVAVLGVTYRPGVDETRASPARPIASMLADRGAEVYLSDPVCSDFSEFAGSPVTIDVLPALDLDAVVIVTAHEEFESVAWDHIDDVVVVDGRQATDPEEIPHPVYTIGAGRADGTEVSQQ